MYAAVSVAHCTASEKSSWQNWHSVVNNFLIPGPPFLATGPNTLQHN